MTLNISQSVFDKYYELIDDTFNIFGIPCQLVSIEKKATSPMDIVDIQLSDGNNWASGSFQYIDKDGSGDVILNSKGYSSFGLEVSSPKLTFKPNKAMISYRTEKDGLIKSILIEFNSKN